MLKCNNRIKVWIFIAPEMAEQSYFYNFFIYIVKLSYQIILFYLA